VSQNDSNLTVNIVIMENGKMPHYASKEAAGADLYASLPDGPIILEPNGGRALVPTSIIIELPKGYEAQIRPRSGLAVNNGVTVLNSPGTIDSDYRGEIKVPLINHGKEPFTIVHHLRIAQMVISPVIRSTFKTVDTANETERGSDGFGSTGV